MDGREKRILMVIPEIIENDIVAAPEKCEREMCFFFIIIIIFGVQVEREKRRRQVSLSLISSGSHYVNTIGLSPMCHISHDPSRPSIHPNCEKEKNVVKKGRRRRLVWAVYSVIRFFSSI